MDSFSSGGNRLALKELGGGLFQARCAGVTPHWKPVEEPSRLELRDPLAPQDRPLGLGLSEGAGPTRDAGFQWRRLLLAAEPRRPRAPGTRREGPNSADIAAWAAPGHGGRARARAGHLGVEGSASLAHGELARLELAVGHVAEQARDLPEPPRKVWCSMNWGSGARMCSGSRTRYEAASRTFLGSARMSAPPLPWAWALRVLRSPVPAAPIASIIASSCKGQRQRHVRDNVSNER